MINEQTTLDVLLQIAKTATEELNPKEQFLLKELFRGFEWNRIKKSNRTKLGGLFYSYANGDESDITVVKKTLQNQWVYEKQ